MHPMTDGNSQSKTAVEWDVFLADRLGNSTLRGDRIALFVLQRLLLEEKLSPKVPDEVAYENFIVGTPHPTRLMPDRRKKMKQRSKPMEFIYKGLKAPFDRHIITDEEVDRQLQRLLQQYPRIAEVTDRPTQAGDEVVLDYAGFCDGEQFAGGTAENQTLVLGSGTFIPGFEEQLLDKVCGEEVVVKVSFPEAYHAENLAGKAAEFRCKIHQIRISTPYELDDVFAKEVGGCETLAEMQAKMKESLQQYTDERGEMDLQDRLLRMAAETLPIDISDEQLRTAVDEQLNTLKAQLQQQGLSIEMYCSFMSTTEEELRKEAEPEALNAIRCRAAVQRIAELEKLEASQVEIGEALEVICRENNMTIEQLQPYYSPEFEQAVIGSVLTRKAMELIRANAVLEG